jgi:ABC-2 type transport system permease protein
MRVSFRRYRAYRAANVAGLVTNGFFGVLRSYVFLALYRERPVAEGFRLLDALTYVWVTQSLIMPVLLWGWVEIANTIRTGEVASDLSKPFSYFGYWLSRDLGRTAYHVLYRMAPTMLLGWVLFRIRLPEHAVTWPLFGASVLLAVVLGFCVRFLINVSAFWTTEVRGISTIALVAVNFLTGFIVPLEFFPAGVREAVQLLPFAGMISIPLNVWLERSTGLDAVGLLLRQALWAGVFVLVCHALLGAATRKLVVQGG